MSKLIFFNMKNDLLPRLLILRLQSSTPFEFGLAEVLKIQPDPTSFILFLVSNTLSRAIHIPKLVLFNFANSDNDDSNMVISNLCSFRHGIYNE